MKLGWVYYDVIENNVAPRAGAWIETVGLQSLQSLEDLSPPVRGRGLKH